MAFAGAHGTFDVAAVSARLLVHQGIQFGDDFVKDLGIVVVFCNDFLQQLVDLASDFAVDAIYYVSLVPQSGQLVEHHDRAVGRCFITFEESWVTRRQLVQRDL